MTRGWSTNALLFFLRNARGKDQDVPFAAGILQINAIIPGDIASGLQPIVLTIGTASSSTEQQVTVFVE